MTENKDKLLLVSFYVDCGRMGTLEGKIIMQESDWQKCQGAEWYASDVLGKHSEYWGHIGDEGEYSTREIDEETAKLICEVFAVEYEFEIHGDYEPPHIPITGFHPIQCLREPIEEEETEEEEEDDDDIN